MDLMFAMEGSSMPACRRLAALFSAPLVLLVLVPALLAAPPAGRTKKQVLDRLRAAYNDTSTELWVWKTQRPRVERELAKLVEDFRTSRKLLDVEYLSRKEYESDKKTDEKIEKLKRRREELLPAIREKRTLLASLDKWIAEGEKRLAKARSDYLAVRNEIVEPHEVKLPPDPYAVPARPKTLEEDLAAEKGAKPLVPAKENVSGAVAGSPVDAVRQAEAERKKAYRRYLMAKKAAAEQVLRIQKGDRDEAQARAAGFRKQLAKIDAEEKEVEKTLRKQAEALSPGRRKAWYQAQLAVKRGELDRRRKQAAEALAREEKKAQALSRKVARAEQKLENGERLVRDLDAGRLEPPKDFKTPQEKAKPSATAGRDGKTRVKIGSTVDSPEMGVLLEKAFEKAPAGAPETDTKKAAGGAAAKCKRCGAALDGGKHACRTKIPVKTCHKCKKIYVGPGCPECLPGLF
jgi:hypothetical protein